MKDSSDFLSCLTWERTVQSAFSLCGTQGFNKKVELASGQQFQYIKCWCFKICFYSGLEQKRNHASILKNNSIETLIFKLKRTAFLVSFSKKMSLELKTVVIHWHLCKVWALAKHYAPSKNKMQKYMSTNFLVISKTK